MKPILFNTDMVRAILEGRKTVTRRVVKFKPGQNPQWTGYIPDGPVLYGSNNIPAAKAPYRAGDILYVRETWRVQAAHRFEADVRIEYKAGWPMRTIQFPGRGNQNPSRVEYDAFIQKWADDKWHPSIHMPKETARLFLRVTDVRAERLQDMCLIDCLKEGGQLTIAEQGDLVIQGIRARDRFSSVWDSTIKTAELPLYGWEANPWVWVISFERVSREAANE